MKLSIRPLITFLLKCVQNTNCRTICGRPKNKRTAIYIFILLLISTLSILLFEVFGIKYWTVLVILKVIGLIKRRSIKMALRPRPELFKHWSLKSQIEAYKTGKVTNWSNPSEYCRYSLT